MFSEPTVQKINEILEKVFGKGVKGNMTGRVVCLNIENLYREFNGLHYIVTNPSFFCPSRIGEFDSKDGSSLILYPRLFNNRRRQARQYRQLYREYFGREATVKIDKA